VWFVIGGATWPNCYLAIACFLYASEEEYVVDSWWLFKYVWIYQSYSDFLCRLSIGFGTHWWWFLHCLGVWNFATSIELKRRWDSAVFIFTLDLFHSSCFSFSCIANFCEKKLFHCRKKVPICIVLLVESKKLYCVLYWLVWCTISYCKSCDIVVYTILACKFREKNTIVITIYAWSFSLKVVSSVCGYWCTSIWYICGDNMIESDGLWAQFEVFTIGGLLADWKYLSELYRYI